MDVLSFLLEKKAHITKIKLCVINLKAIKNAYQSCPLSLTTAIFIIQLPS